MIYLIDLEYVETRYTAQWKTEFPAYLKKQGLDVTVIDGPDDIAECATPGAFLNFSGTNVYKSVQVQKIAELFTKNLVKDGDKFLFADAWHPGIINLKYMIELLGVKAEIHALWHAGSYDPQDFLGRLIGDARWVRHTEKAYFEAIDYNYFASGFHIDMFLENLLDKDPRDGRMNYMPSGKITRTGWPMSYYTHNIAPKEDIILFPHRIAPEKQPEIFRDLQKQLPEYQLIMCQEENLTKAEYHKLLGKAKMVFSANLQETLGIGCYEILCSLGMPLVPDTLSYKEMYYDCFKYSPEWTSSFKAYEENKDLLVGLIRHMMSNYYTDDMINNIQGNREFLRREYFTASNMIETLKG